MTDNPTSDPATDEVATDPTTDTPATDTPAADTPATDEVSTDVAADVEPTAGAPVTPPAAEVSSGPVTVSRVTRGRARPRGTRKELFVWYLMRVTGVALFVLALGHFSVLHFIWDPAEQTAEFITNERWSQIFWRLFDWLLLMTVLFHGFLGMRTVILDYIQRPGLRTGTLWLLYVTGLILFVIGTQVIVTLPMPGAE